MKDIEMMEEFFTDDEEFDAPTFDATPAVTNTATEHQ